jgi:aryl-phospho-beta-D-glucosidase BglC (GH1 family)
MIDRIALIAVGLLAILALCEVANATQLKGELLPAGYLSVNRSQIVDSSGRKVKLACVGYDQVGANIASDMKAIAAYGFNCLRYPWFNATLAANLATADAIVADAGAVGLKVILDHHADETPSPSNGWLTANCNGLPFDSGSGADGSDGCGDTGTVTRARFVSDWVSVAKRYAGNSTVIGFDLTNEPHLFPSGWTPPGGATWGDGSATDLQAIYTEAGNAIQTVNPDALIIVEGVLNWTSNLANGRKVYIEGYPDLSLAESKPVILSLPNKLVYSIHDYPLEISGVTSVSGPTKVATMNETWGYLVSKHFAPVWIGEMGASLDAHGADTQNNKHKFVPGKLADEQYWKDIMLAYLNGRDGAAGGPEFSGCEQAIGTDWWHWGDLTGEAPDGTLNDKGKPRPAQQAVTRQLAFIRKKGC